MRGLDYYNRTVFEIKSSALGSQSAVCGGGRYDGLVEMLGGQATPAVGFAMGQNIETRMDYIPEKSAYLVGGDFSAGAVVIDDKGVVGVLSGIAG